MAREENSGVGWPQASLYPCTISLLATNGFIGHLTWRGVQRGQSGQVMVADPLDDKGKKNKDVLSIFYQTKPPTLPQFAPHVRKKDVCIQIHML